MTVSFHKFGGGYFPGTGDIGNMGHGGCGWQQGWGAALPSTLCPLAGGSCAPWRRSVPALTLTALPAVPRHPLCSLALSLSLSLQAPAACTR